jgi:cob(I)alamin adenosyltransferase
MPKFYTKNGDDGTTGLLGDKRVEKFNIRIEALGALDELSTALGVARSFNPEPIQGELKKLQVLIYMVMSELAATAENSEKFNKIDKNTITELENKILGFSKLTKLPDEFILPGDSTPSAFISFARSTARRAERRVVELFRMENLKNEELLRFINRLSSYLYILEIYSVQIDSSAALSIAKSGDK